MHMMPEPGMHGHNTFWVDSQVSFTFTISAAQRESILEAINLRDLSTFLRDRHFLLEALGESEHHDPGSASAQPADQHMLHRPTESSGQKLPGIYVFSGPRGDETLLVVAFFQFKEAFEATPGQQQAGNSRYHCEDPGSQPVPRLVNLVNGNLETLQRGGIKSDDGRILQPVPITSAAPHWLFGSSDHVTTGCPLMPPIPVPADRACSSASGLWPISLPHLPEELQQTTGAGVTVLVLDTLPPWGDIHRATEAAGRQNLRLLDLVNNVRFVYPHLQDTVDLPNPQEPQTGKDIWGRSLHFHLPDHGLFIAGIIRDLAPDAHVLCARVLNDLGAGATSDLIAQFQDVQRRILAAEEYYDRDVVINLSLVIPSDEDLQGSFTDLDAIRLFLRETMRHLTALGVMFVAAAGNEGDSRQQQGGKRPDALYPAAFANQDLPNLIPVGAVNEHGETSGYSCYPGVRGVATYGGELPRDSDVYQEHGMTHVDTDCLDAMVGVYTRLTYPALSADDAQTTYPAPNTHGWTYWIGTSFATPIVTAVVARACEQRRIHPQEFATQPLGTYVLAQAATAQITWTNLASSPVPRQGGMIVAHQCTCREHVHEQDAYGHNEVRAGATAHGHS
jgi:hypothetical protein